MPADIQSDLIRDVCSKYKCNWAEARELIQDAQKELDISSIETDEQRSTIITKVGDLWEIRKPTPEEIARKKQEKEEALEKKKEEEKEAERQERLKSDADFRFIVCICITCGLWLWCAKGGLFRRDKEEEEEE